MVTVVAMPLCCMSSWLVPTAARPRGSARHAGSDCVREISGTVYFRESNAAASASPTSRSLHCTSHRLPRRGPLPQLARPRVHLLRPPDMVSYGKQLEKVKVHVQATLSLAFGSQHRNEIL
jgi:hypothetical protein